MGEKAHALLSASGAARWLNCPPSARFEETFPDETSQYAKEGSLAHSIAELMLRKQFTEPISTQKFKSAFKKLQKDPLYQSEMDGYVSKYVDYVLEKVHSFGERPYVAIEKRLDYSTFAPEGFGTGDCIIIGDGRLIVADFKYGKGVSVSCEDNPQMKLYALGAINAYSMLYEIKEITLAVVQPRLNNISEWQISISDLLIWGESIKAIAQMAYAGGGEFSAGDHCRFCRARRVCRARSDFYLSLESEHSYAIPPALSNDAAGEILDRAILLAAWVSDLQEYSLKTILAGGEVKGWKAVSGRSNRKFKDTDSAFELLTSAGYDEALLYEKKPITLTAVEKLAGKDFETLLGSEIIKAPGAPTLAHQSDKRDAIINKISTQEAFDGLLK